MTSSPALITLSGVSHWFGTRQVLENIALTLRPGEIITLIGPNGCGKTTLAKIVLGLLMPREGRVERQPGIRLGYMPQKLTIDPILPLTVRRFLELAGTMQLPTLAEQIGITELLDMQVHHLSGGEMQRVLLTRALLAEPQLLVLDEPVQGLDIGGQAEFYQLLETIVNTRHCGVLMVSHDLHTVMASTHHVICMNRHICCEGLPQHVGTHPAYLALFGKEGKNMAVYSHTHDHDHYHHHHHHGDDHA